MSLIAVNHIPAERIVNKAGLLNFFQIGGPSLDNWIRRGCPYLERGGRGIEWKFDLLDVARWRFTGSVDGDPGRNTSPDDLTPRERLVWYQGSMARARYLKQVGQLVDAAQYETDLADVIKIVISGVDPLQDRLERDCQLSSDALETVERAINSVRTGLHIELQKFAKKLEERQSAPDEEKAKAADLIGLDGELTGEPV